MKGTAVSFDGPITGEADRCRAWLLMCHDDTCWTTSCLGVGAPRAEESLVDPLSCHGFAVRKHMGIPAGVRELRVPEQLANGLQVEVVVEHHRRRRVSEVVEPPRGILCHLAQLFEVTVVGSRIGRPAGFGSEHPSAIRPLCPYLAGQSFCGLGLAMGSELGGQHGRYGQRTATGFRLWGRDFETSPPTLQAVSAALGGLSGAVDALWRDQRNHVAKSPAAVDGG